MTRPSVPCASSSSTIVQWKALARLPQCVASLFSRISGFSGLVGCGIAVADALDLEMQVDRGGDHVLVARHAEVEAVERRACRETGFLLEQVRICADAVERHRKIDRLLDATEIQFAVHDRVGGIARLDGNADE